MKLITFLQLYYFLVNPMQGPTRSMLLLVVVREVDVTVQDEEPEPERGEAVENLFCKLII